METEVSATTRARIFGMFGSECGREWAIPHSDFFEGLSGVSGRVFSQPRSRHAGRDGGAAVRNGLPRLRSRLRQIRLQPGSAGEYVAHHALCGRTLNYHSFPNHLYWKAASQNEAVQVKARPGVTAVEATGPRKFRIRYRWQVEGDGNPAGDWRVFVHFGKGEPIPFQNDHAPSRPVATWRAGDVIDEGPFDVTVPESFTADSAEIYMGLCRSDGGAERAMLPGCGTDQRVLAGRLRIKPAIAFEALPKQALAGDPGCFTRADNGWAEGMCMTDRFLKNTQELLGPLAAITTHARLTRFEFLTPDRSVRRAVFSGPDGKAAATVTVNFGTADFAAQSERGGEVILPVWGVLIESPEFVAFHARSWAGRTYESPVLFTVRTESGATRIFHGFGDARIQWGGEGMVRTPGKPGGLGSGPTHLSALTVRSPADARETAGPKAVEERMRP